jgi:hypothetical protein
VGTFGAGIAWGALAGLVGLAAVAACSSPAALLGQGGQCLQTTDCENGLVCVPQPNNGPKICSSNLATTVSTEEAGTTAPTDAPTGDGNVAPGDGAPPGDTGSPTDGGARGKPDATEAMEAQAAPPKPEAAPPVDAPPETAPSTDDADTTE